MYRLFVSIGKRVVFCLVLLVCILGNEDINKPLTMAEFIPFSYVHVLAFGLIGLVLYEVFRYIAIINYVGLSCLLGVMWRVLKVLYKALIILIKGHQ